MATTRLQNGTKVSTPGATGFSGLALQRKCGCGGSAGVMSECDDCQGKKLSLQRSIENSELGTRNSDGVPRMVHEVLRSPGQPLDLQARAFFEPRFGQDFSRVRVHADAQAAESAAAVAAKAYTVGADLVFGAAQYSPQTSAGRRLLAHELMHVVQQNSASVPSSLSVASASDPREAQADQMANAIDDQTFRSFAPLSLPAPAIQRDLVTEPPEDVPEQRELTPAQIQRALNYNRASYNEESTREIQDIVGGPVTGRFEEETIRLIALIQRQYGLVPADGKVGPNTYDFLIRELQAGGAPPTDCITLFQMVGPQPLAFFRINATSGTIQTGFDIHARFDPRCDCSDFEYRQFIAGHVELTEPLAAGRVAPATSGCAVRTATPPGMVVWSMDGCFGNLPAGRLTANMQEDGDTSIGANIAGRHYGHRSARPHPTDRRDRYLPDRATGCTYEGFDVPELGPIPAGPLDTGDVFDWETRFHGVIQHRDGTLVSEHWWSIIDTVVIP
jgi:hypothetical protein